MLWLFEFSVLLVFAASIPLLIRQRNYPMLTVAAISTATVLIGEYVNAYQTKATAYPPDYRFWLPGGLIPVCIVCAGILLNLVFFGIITAVVNATARSQRQRIVMTLLVAVTLSLLTPFIERTCVMARLWQWQRPSAFTVGWFLGVHRYYAIYLLSALIPGWYLYEKRKCK